MSLSINEIFAADARKYAGRLRSALFAPGGPDIDGIRRASRRLNHAAVLADHESVVRASTALQRIAVQVLAGKRVCSDDLLAGMNVVVEALERVVTALPERDRVADSELRVASEALILPGGSYVSGGDLRREPDEAGVERPPEEGRPGQAESRDETTIAPPAERLAEEAEERDAPAGPAAGPTAALDESDSLLAALIEDLGDAVERLQNDPRNREPLKTLLRRIRRLNQLERLQPHSPEKKALAAVEELILQIADLNATVGPGYLSVFRHARQLLEGLRDREGSRTLVGEIGGRADEVDQLKASVMAKARLARQVVWVSELFYQDGPHVVSCPRAERESGSADAYFLREARERLDRSESLRRTMLESNTEQMRLAGESLAHTLRHLRERAAAFDHPGLGRVTRRTAAALRAQLVRPPSRLRALAAGFGEVFAALGRYLESEDPEERTRAIGEAEERLQQVVSGDAPTAPEAAPLDPDAALQHALSLRTRIDERLGRLSGSAVEELRQDLEALFDLLAYYVSASGERH